MSPFVFIAFSTVFGICGQLLLKSGMTRLGVRSGGSFIKGIITSPWVIGGLLVYGTGVIFWMLALSYFEISYVYPFASLSYIGIILGSYFIFKERLSLMRLAGIAMIIAGVLITSQS
jgi:multidrug transporter EmrE-like cation transporter